MSADIRQVIGTYEMNGQTREVSVTMAASGAFWTTNDGICGGRDYKTRRGAVAFLKKTMSEMGVNWTE